MGCLTCGSHVFTFLFETNGYRIEKCVDCDLVQVTNVPSAEKIAESYGEEFYERYYRGVTNGGRRQRYVYFNFGNKMDQIERRVRKPGKVLDVGCSFGFFLEVARQRGWEVVGVEMSEHSLRYARDRLGLTVIDKPIEEAGFEERSFDVITMWAVIEHLPNPKQVLQELARVLKDDGMLVLHTGNVDSYRARIEGSRWRMWIPPVHLVYFSPSSMHKLVERCGLRVVEYATALPYETYFRRIGLYGTLNRMGISDNVIYYVRKKQESGDGCGIGTEDSGSQGLGRA